MSRASNNLRPIMVVPSPGLPRRAFPVTPYPTITSFTPTPTSSSYHAPFPTTFCHPHQQTFYNTTYYPYNHLASVPSSPTAGYRSDSSSSANSDPITPHKFSLFPQTYTRLFTPRLLGLKSTLPSNVSHYDTNTQITHTIWYTPDHSFVDPGTVLVHLSGGINPAPSVGRHVIPWYSVHHGPGSRWNKSGELPVTERIPTVLHAELHGLEELLGQVGGIMQATNGAVRNVVIATGSAKLHNGVVYGLEHWERKGWRKKGGRKSVANRAGWMRVKGLVEGLESRGVGVRVWLTKPEEQGQITKVGKAGKGQKVVGEAEKVERERDRRVIEWRARQKAEVEGKLEAVMNAMMALKGEVELMGTGKRMQREVVWLPVMVPREAQMAQIPGLRRSAVGRE